MKTVLFDLDGTLGDTLPLCMAAFREAIEPLAGRRLSDEQIVAAFGPSEEGTVAMLLPDRKDEALLRYLERYEALHGCCPEPFPGVREILDYLKSRRVCVGLVTGKGPRSAAMTLARFGLGDCFDVVKTGEASGPVKDRRIEEVIAEFSPPREDVLYVGDSPSDVTACRQCGIRIAAAAWSPTADVEALRAMRPDHLFTSIPPFFAFLKSFCGD
ncbi:MAG: HAD family hydrolase [Planctomycetes bacterium]|nr:HAD family hydrolase [Planctomycetota bacterium]